MRFKSGLHLVGVDLDAVLLANVIDPAVAAYDPYHRALEEVASGRDLAEVVEELRREGD